MKFIKNAWNAVCQFTKTAAAKTAAVVGGVGAVVGSLFSAQPAQAALDANIATGLTGLQTDFSALMALVYPVMIGVVTALAIFSLVKKLVKKSMG